MYETQKQVTSVHLFWEIYSFSVFVLSQRDYEKRTTIEDAKVVLTSKTNDVEFDVFSSRNSRSCRRTTSLHTRAVDLILEWCGMPLSDWYLRGVRWRVGGGTRGVREG